MNKLSIVFLIGILFALTSCEKDLLEIPDTDPRDDFIASWNCTDNEVKSTLDSYNVNITYDPTNSGQVLLENFGLLGNDIKPYAYITGSRITIPEQTLSNDYVVSGEGKLVSADLVELTYSTDDGADLLSFEAVFTK